MKLSHNLILPALCWSARLAAAATAHVYIHDPQSQPKHDTPSRSLHPVPARLVLAQRAGVEDYHSADISREEVIDAINDYGLRTPLFAEDSLRKAFILVQAESDSAAALPSLRSYTSFEIDPAPAAPASKGLFLDIAKQSDPDGFAHLSDDDLSTMFKQSRVLSQSADVFYIAKSMADFEDAFTGLAKENKFSVTGMILPPGEWSRTGQGKYQWGTYEMPGAQSMLRKRQQMKEEPLTETIEWSPAESFTAPVSTFAGNNTTPLKGILPACFSTQSACESATRNCTNHGKCTKKYHDKTSNSQGGGDCYSCSCISTTSNGGKLTTKWGGPACQKKDVSIEFWLIVLFTVGMIFLVGFAIGSVYDMGKQELPSVIGAGVSGPTARQRT